MGDFELRCKYMGRQIKQDSKPVEETHGICIKCKKRKLLSQDFYSTESDLYPNKKFPVCKDCLTERLPNTNDFNSEEYTSSVKSILMDLNKPFIFSIWTASLEESQRRQKNPFGMYMKNVNLPQNRNLTWKDSDFTVPSTTEMTVFEHKYESNVEVIDNRNKDDVLRMLGYDPFESENESDKRYLYNKLVDFLDESTLEDSFKLPTVIEIVKSFNQLDKINSAIASIMSDAKQLSNNIGGIKSLIDAKEKMLKSVLALAKDNGISVNHNNNKSKGGGTLTGIIKTLQEKGFQEAAVNLFDVETAEGMRQVADISNQSIYRQLQFDENDYTAMIMEQREIIHELEAKTSKLEEENRKLKVQIKTMTSGGDMIEQ
jgi:hypothetical protein